jgi:glycosyltransferase involved in cell wall biosynthesis
MSDDLILSSSEVLFIGNGRSAVCWYRIAMPAMFLGCDWVGVDDNFNLGTGIVRGGTQMPNFDDYKVIIWQQPRSPHARQLMDKLQRQGKKVIIDCDDYLEGVRKAKDHDFRNEKAFSKKEMDIWQRTLRKADGLILSTDWLAAKYSEFNKNVWICKNGLDMGRYDKDRADHPGVNIGWAGATGHMMAFTPLVDAIERILKEFPYTNFISIGQPFANEFAQRGVEQKRLVAVPWTSIELYPNAMTMFDIALAPARESNWYKAKSQLRYYESAAVGAATVGTSWLYDEILDGITGMKVEEGTSDEWYEKIKILVTDHHLRQKMQRMARHVAREEFDMHNRRRQWMDVLEHVARRMQEEKIEEEDNGTDDTAE